MRMIENGNKSWHEGEDCYDTDVSCHIFDVFRQK